jgi:chromosome segregation ATPase
MNIPKDILSEKNYTGTRLIRVENTLVYKLKKELNELQKKANPTLAKMDIISKKLDPYYAQIGQLDEKIKLLKQEVAPHRELYDIEVKKVELIDQKAQLIKNKIQPIVDAEIQGKLEEFEKPLHVTDKKGVLYVEVQNELEETIKNIRARNAKIKTK